MRCSTISIARYALVTRSCLGFSLLYHTVQYCGYGAYNITGPLLSLVSRSEAQWQCALLPLGNFLTSYPFKNCKHQTPSWLWILDLGLGGTIAYKMNSALCV